MELAEPRSIDDPLHFRQVSVWDDVADFERYWASDEITALRLAALNYYNNLTQLADKLTRQGITINPVDQAPFRARLDAYYQTWASNFGPTAWSLLQNSLGRKLA